MAFRRWTLTDGTTTVTLPINPKTQTGIFAARNITSSRTVGGKVVLSEGSRSVATMQVSGVILDKSHYELLLDWFDGSHSQRVIKITDQYGRQIECVFTSFDPAPPPTKPTPGYAWYQSFEATFTVISVTHGDRGNNWEPV